MIMLLAFIWLSSVLLINALAKGNLTILQGMRQLRAIAKSTVIGSVIGVFTAFPLYYYFGVEGIIPAIIIAALTSLAVSTYYTKKIKLRSVNVTYKETLYDGKEMTKLGVLMMISLFLGALVTYVLNAFIRYKGGISDVGLYQAGLSISDRFIGLVFVAMGTDFFPRLSGISKDNERLGKW